MNKEKIARESLTEWQISRATGNADLEHEKATEMVKAVRAALNSSTPREVLRTIDIALNDLTAQVVSYYEPRKPVPDDLKHLIKRVQRVVRRDCYNADKARK